MAGQGIPITFTGFTLPNGITVHVTGENPTLKQALQAAGIAQVGGQYVINGDHATTDLNRPLRPNDAVEVFAKPQAGGR